MDQAIKPIQNPVNMISANASANLPNFFDFISMISPYLVVFFILFNSIVNSNIKGLIYITGLVILFIITFLFQRLTTNSSTTVPNPMCSMFNIGINISSIPSFSIALVTYTLIYIFIPMISNNVINYPFIIILSFILISNVFYRINKNCTTYLGALTGGFLGFIWGSIYYAIIKTNDPKLTYYDDFISNKVACSRPSKQQFKCSVYKNGELLQTI